MKKIGIGFKRQFSKPELYQSIERVKELSPQFSIEWEEVLDDIALCVLKLDGQKYALVKFNVLAQLMQTVSFETVEHAAIATAILKPLSDLKLFSVEGNDSEEFDWGTIELPSESEDLLYQLGLKRNFSLQGLGEYQL